MRGIKEVYYGVRYGVEDVTTEIEPATCSLYEYVRSGSPALATQLDNAINTAIEKCDALDADGTPFRERIGNGWDSTNKAAATACLKVQELLEKVVIAINHGAVSL